MISILRSAVATACLVATPALAADVEIIEPPPVPDVSYAEEPRLEWTIVPFNAWVPGIKGTIGILGNAGQVDLSPIDILSDLDTYLEPLNSLYFGTGQVRYDKFGLMYDIFYFDVGGGLEFVGQTVDVGYEQFMGTFAGTYRFHESERGHIDALAGLRYQDIGVDVAVAPNVTLSDGGSWLDPIVGVAGRYNLTDRWYVNGWGMIGGFGVGSDLTWDMWGNIGYQWHDWLDIYVGVRAAGTDYSDGSFTWDVTQYGPTLGAALKF